MQWFSTPLPEAVDLQQMLQTPKAYKAPNHKRRYASRVKRASTYPRNASLEWGKPAALFLKLLFFGIRLGFHARGCRIGSTEKAKQSPLHMVLLHTAWERLKICCVCRKTARCGTKRGKVLTHLPLASRSTCIQRILPMKVFKIKDLALPSTSPSTYSFKVHGKFPT